MNDRFALLLLESPDCGKARRRRLPGGAYEVGGHAGQESVDAFGGGQGEDAVGTQDRIGIVARIEDTNIHEDCNGVHLWCPYGSPGPVHQDGPIRVGDDDVVTADVRVGQRNRQPHP